MSHRTQITLEDSQYARLLEESRKSGLSLSELVRRAIDSAQGSASGDERRRHLDISFGAWGEFEGDGVDYVARSRRGLGRRLERM